MVEVCRRCRIAMVSLVSEKLICDEALQRWPSYMCSCQRELPSRRRASKVYIVAGDWVMKSPLERSHVVIRLAEVWWT